MDRLVMIRLMVKLGYIIHNKNPLIISKCLYKVIEAF